MVALTSQGWLSAALGHGMGSSHVRAGIRIWIDGSKVMVCEWSRSEVVDFVCPYRVGIECEKECKIILNGEEMEVNEFKYLGSVMCKRGGTAGETRERALQGRKVVGSLGRIKKTPKRNVAEQLKGKRKRNIENAKRNSNEQ